jgi:predicted alpha/beta-fold hydrolase
MHLKRVLGLTALVTTGVTAYNVYQDCVVGRPNTIHVNEQSDLHDIVHSIFDTNSFKPTWWMRNTHSQTIMNALGRRLTDKLSFTRECIPLSPDCGYCVYLDHVQQEQAIDSHKYILIIPGVFAGTEGVSVKQFVQHATRHGYNCIIMNFTDDRDSTAKTVIPGLTHVSSEDIHTVVQYIRKQIPDKSPLYALGISLGSNLLVKYLGNPSYNTQIDGAICLANPFDLNRTAHTLAGYWINFYDKQLLVKRKSIMMENLRYYFTPQLMEDVRQELNKVESNIEFDLKFTLQLIKQHIQDDANRLKQYMGEHGDNIQSYYEQQSCVRDVSNVQVPMLCINAKDDRISLIDSVPFHVTEENKNVAFVCTERGGHVGWLSGTYPLSNESASWVEHCSIQYLNALQQLKKNSK